MPEEKEGSVGEIPSWNLCGWPKKRTKDNSMESFTCKDQAEERGQRKLRNSGLKGEH